jgi:PAS domain S-box-containing protein
MQLRKKIILSFFIVISLVWLIGIILINISKNKIKSYIEEDSYYSISSISHFVKTEIDLEISGAVARSQEFALQQFAQEANRKLANMKNPREYIQNKDSWWVNFPSNRTDKFIDEIININKSKKILCGDLCFGESGSVACANAVLTDSLGGLILAPMRPKKYDYYQETWWKEAKENGLYINDCLYDENLKKYLMEIFVSIKDNQGHFLGVQRISISLEDVLKSFFEYINENLRHSHYDTKYTIIDTTGKVFFSESGYSFLDKYRDVEAIKLNYNKKNIELTDKNGEAKVIFFNFIHGKGDDKNYSWIIIAEHDRGLIYADVNLVTNNILLLCVFLIVICMILIYVFINKVLSPIQLLHDEVQKIRKGGLTDKVGVNITDDFSDIGKTFNEMFEKIVYYQEQISLQKKEMAQIFNNFKEEIQEKVKNKELFLEEKEKLIVTLKSIQDAVITVNNDGVITMMNSCAENLTGVTFKNDEKMHIESIFFIHEHRTRSFKDILKLLNSPEHNNYLSEKVNLISSNGTRYFIYNCISAIVNSQNLMIGVIFVFRDIAGLSTIEKEILESESRYRNLVNNARIGIFRSNVDGKLISINSAFVNIVQGESTEKVLGEVIDIRKQLFYSQTNQFNVFKELEEGSGSMFFEQRLFTLTGKLIIVSFSLSLVRDKFGNSEFIDGFMEDITERKSAEENFYKIFNNNPEYMVLSTFDTGVILNVNKSFTDMFGFSRDDLIGKDSKEFDIWIN